MCNFVKEAAAINIEDIYFFEVNTEYILSRVSKTSEFSRVRSTSENSDVFHSRDEIYLVFTEKRKFYFYFILFIKKGGTENAKTNNFANPNNIRHVLTKKMHTHTQ